MTVTKQTLDPAVKAAFASAGVSLTPEQEHVAATATAIDWLAVLKSLGGLAAQLLPIIIAFFGNPPAKAAAAGCCDHHACCLKVFESAVKTAKLAGEHLCSCCCE